MSSEDVETKRKCSLGQMEASECGFALTYLRFVPVLTRITGTKDE